MCVDRDDVLKKARQARLVRKIYQSIEQVVAWFGMGMDGPDAIDAL